MEGPRLTCSGNVAAALRLECLQLRMHRVEIAREVMDLG